MAASTLVGACGTSASDRDAALAAEGGSTETTVTTTTTTTRNPAVEARGEAAPAPAAARRAAPEPARRAAAEPARRAAFTDVTIPSGTTLQLSLNTAVASDTSNVEDAVSARLTSAVVVNGRTVVPAGATVAGFVTDADDAGHVKGRARVAMDFTSLTTGGSRYAISAAEFAQLAPATKSEDATKIGVGAGAGAIIGGILGGKKGAAQGAAVGGAGGTGVVLATRGKEVRLADGADVSTQLTAPLTIRFAD